MAAFYTVNGTLGCLPDRFMKSAPFIIIQEFLQERQVSLIAYLAKSPGSLPTHLGILVSQGLAESGDGAGLTSQPQSPGRAATYQRTLIIQHPGQRGGRLGITYFAKGFGCTSPHPGHLVPQGLDKVRDRPLVTNFAQSLSRTPTHPFALAR
jgi:hypothetical protein